MAIKEETVNEMRNRLSSVFEDENTNGEVFDEIDRLNEVIQSTKWDRTKITEKYFHVQLAEWLLELSCFKEQKTFLGIKDWFMPLTHGIEEITGIVSQIDKQLRESPRKDYEVIRGWLLDLYYQRSIEEQKEKILKEITLDNEVKIHEKKPE